MNPEFLEPAPSGPLASRVASAQGVTPAVGSDTRLDLALDARWAPLGLVAIGVRPERPPRRGLGVWTESAEVPGSEARATSHGFADCLSCLEALPSVLLATLLRCSGRDPPRPHLGVPLRGQNLKVT